MKRNSLFIFLILSVSLLLPLACAYSCYNLIMEADFLRNGVKYEAVDVENLLLDKQNLLGMISSPFSVLLFLKDGFFAPFLDFFLSIPATYQTSSILRC